MSVDTDLPSSVQREAARIAKRIAAATEAHPETSPQETFCIVLVAELALLHAKIELLAGDSQ